MKKSNPTFIKNSPNYDFASLYPTSFGKSLWLFEKERLRKERKEKLQKIKENSEK